jgi:hypothetical protein
MIDAEHQRPKEQWWLELKGIASLLAKPEWLRWLMAGIRARMGAGQADVRRSGKRSGSLMGVNVVPVSIWSAGM